MALQMLIATHKDVALPRNDFYQPILVGHAINGQETDYLTDDVGTNISNLNRSYCELTALYWAWKNLTNVEYVGLSHYRRYFRGDMPGPNGSSILSEREAMVLLDKYDIVLAKPRNYYVETIESHYRNGHVGSDLEVLRTCIEELSPERLGSFDKIMSGRRISLYNMFLMRFSEFASYCEWLFPILEAVSEQIDNDSRDSYQQRTFGYLGERLLNVWALSRESELRIGTRGIVNTDGEPKMKKGIEMLRRKFS